MKTITHPSAVNKESFKPDTGRKQNKVIRFPNSKAYSLHKLEQEIAKIPVVDSNRRNAIRNAIANGHYIANPGTIAKKLIDMELILFKNKKV